MGLDLTLIPQPKGAHSAYVASTQLSVKRNTRLFNKLREKAIRLNDPLSFEVGNHVSTIYDAFGSHLTYMYVDDLVALLSEDATLIDDATYGYLCRTTSGTKVILYWH